MFSKIIVGDGVLDVPSNVIMLQGEIADKYVIKPNHTTNNKFKISGKKVAAIWLRPFVLVILF